jgi:polyisoprenoid-binding protein YceI
MVARAETLGSRSMFRNTLWATLLWVGAVSAVAAPARVQDAKVSFHGKGPAGFALVGTTTTLALDDNGQRLELSVPLDTLKTGIDLRDRHMREKYLETSKFPTATLVVDKAQVKLPSKDGDSTSGDATGQLTVHGVTRSQRFSYVVQKAGRASRVTAQLKMSFKDHGVSVPSYLGITVKPDLEVKVAFTAP